MVTESCTEPKPISGVPGGTQSLTITGISFLFNAPVLGGCRCSSPGCPGRRGCMRKCSDTGATPHKQDRTETILRLCSCLTQALTSFSSFRNRFFSGIHALHLHRMQQFYRKSTGFRTGWTQFSHHATTPRRQVQHLNQCCQQCYGRGG